MSALTAGPPPVSIRDSTEGTPLTSPARRGPVASARAGRSGTISTVPPAISGHSSSKTETSKLSEVEATTWSRRPANRRAAQSARWATLRWVTTTPLGRPVEPEV